MSSAYFTNFPLVGYALHKTGQPGEFQWVTNIFLRSAPVADLLKHNQIFYPYVIPEGYTPEVLADNYYGSVNYHWVITLLNNITDPVLDWPKGYSNLVRYIVNKYGSVASASGSIHHYTMTEVKTDSLGNSNTATYIIDQTKYNTLTSPTPVVYTFRDGNTVTVTTSRSTVDNYTYEVALNEAKRNIVLLQAQYLPQILSEFETLMSK
jgi:hypothetical protein